QHTPQTNQWPADAVVMGRFAEGLAWVDRSTEAIYRSGTMRSVDHNLVRAFHGRGQARRADPIPLDSTMRYSSIHRN
ncbi:MAG: hypothetical protein AAFO29_25085, partial [Actinomycetota bacterium]